MTHAVSMSQVTVGYNGIPAVHDLSLTVAPGEIVTLLGPNGAGKTTTLLSIAGLLKPTRGTVEVLGRPVDTRLPQRNARRGLGFVPEDRAVFAQLTTLENLRLGRGWGRESQEKVLEYFPALEKVLDRKAGLLSGGEQQMLSLGRALVGKPRVLLIDEMSLGLAPIIVENLLTLVRTIARGTGTAVLLVEQHVKFALEIADRAYVLRHGHLALEGPAHEIAGKPEMLRASYLGEASQPG